MEIKIGQRYKIRHYNESQGFIIEIVKVIDGPSKVFGKIVQYSEGEIYPFNNKNYVNLFYNIDAPHIWQYLLGQDKD